MSTNAITVVHFRDQIHRIHRIQRSEHGEYGEFGFVYITDSDKNIESYPYQFPEPTMHTLIG